MSVDLVIKGGRIVSPEGTYESAVAVDGGRIVGIGEPAAMPQARQARDRKTNPLCQPTTVVATRGQAGVSGSTSRSASSLVWPIKGWATGAFGQTRSQAGRMVSCMANPRRTPTAENRPKRRIGARSLYHKDKRPMAVVVVAKPSGRAA